MDKEEEKEANELLEERNKLLDKNSKKIKAEIELLKKINSSEEDIDDTIEDQYETEEKINTSLKKRKTILDSLNETCNSIKKSALDILHSANLQLFSFDGLFGETLKINSELNKMSATLGEVNGNGFTQVKNAFVTATKGIGESFESARETVDSLIESGYIGNFNEATKAISLFSKATDVSRRSVAETYDFLNKTMRMSEGSITSIYASMQKISQTYGLTKKGMTEVTTSIKTMASNMKAFGSSEANVKTMAVSTAKLASQFEKVGLEASKATTIVNQLTNPDNIENNIGLYAQLGISLSDALTGNFDGEQLNAGLADFGNRLKEMGPIAGAAFAKTFNVSYQDAMKWADMEQITEDAITPEVKAMDQLANSLDKTQDAFASVQTMLNKIKGMFSALGPAFLGVIAFVAPKIVGFIATIVSSIKESFDELNNRIDETIEKIESGNNRINNRKKGTNLLESQNKTAKVQQDEAMVKIDKFSNLKNNIQQLDTKDEANQLSSKLAQLNDLKAGIKNLDTSDLAKRGKQIEKLKADINAIDVKGISEGLGDKINKMNGLKNELAKSGMSDSDLIRKLDEKIKQTEQLKKSVDSLNIAGTTEQLEGRLRGLEKINDETGKSTDDFVKLIDKKVGSIDDIKKSFDNFELTDLSNLVDKKRGDLNKSIVSLASKLNTEDLSKTIEKNKKGLSDSIKQFYNASGNERKEIYEQIKEHAHMINRLSKIEKVKKPSLKERLGDISGVNKFKINRQVAIAKGSNGFTSVIKALFKTGTGLVGGILKGIGKFFGPIGIALAVLTPLLKKNAKFMKKIQEIIDVFSKTVEESIMPIVDELVEGMMPILNLVLKIMAPVIRFLGKVLHILLTPVLMLVKLIGKLCSIFGGNEETTQANTTALEENTEAQGNSAEQIRARADGRVIATKGSFEGSAYNSSTEVTKVTTEKTVEKGSFEGSAHNSSTEVINNKVQQQSSEQQNNKSFELSMLISAYQKFDEALGNIVKLLGDIKTNDENLYGDNDLRGRRLANIIEGSARSFAFAVKDNNRSNYASNLGGSGREHEEDF